MYRHDIENEGRSIIPANTDDRGSTPAAGNLSQFNQPPRSTQHGHPFVGRRNEYRSKGGDALRLGSKGRYGVACR